MLPIAEIPAIGSYVIQRGQPTVLKASSGSNRRKSWTR